jgi:hypothetical protein
VRHTATSCGAEKGKRNLVRQIEIADTKDEWQEIAATCFENLESFEQIENRYKNPEFTGGVLATIRLTYCRKIIKEEMYEDLLAAVDDIRKSVLTLMDDACNFQYGDE